MAFSSYPEQKYCVKIGDFGLSTAKGKEVFTSCLVTTVVYTAPEMVGDEGNTEHRLFAAMQCREEGDAGSRVGL